MKKHFTAAAAMLLIMTSTGVYSQVVSHKDLSLEGAQKIIAAAGAEARRKQTTGVIAVVDAGGNLIALERIDNTFPAGANVSIGKARTAALFRKPTAFFEEIIRKGRTAMTALQDFTPLQGGVPVVIGGEVVGGVGVSGAASAQQDEELAIVGAAAVTDMSPSPAPMGDMMRDEMHGDPMMVAASMTASSPSGGEVSFYASNEVKAAFAKGAVLYNGAKYMVHTSRRTGPGMAEVHTKDADIIYVQSGTATFVTGGEMVEAKSIAADEIRGREIRGGETRTISPGDVIIVPAGTPHWFKEIQGPVTYYVVKSR